MASMTHPELPGVTIDVEVSAVPIHMASGWVPVDGKATAAAEAAAAAEEAGKQASADSSADEDGASASSRKKTSPSAKES